MTSLNVCRIALFATIVFSLTALADGPYVSQQDSGQWIAKWVEGDDTAPRVLKKRVAVGWNLFTPRTVTVPAVGKLPAFKVRLRKPDPSPRALAADEISLASETPLFVIADTHGEFEIAVELLQQHRIIDSKLQWIFKNGHLAILGDVFDRGPNHTEILWLLYKLEAEAERVGGAVHLILGNHETLVMLGSHEYLNPKYLQTSKALAAQIYAELWNTKTLLDQWLRTRPAVQKIGDSLCLHGGISAELVNQGYTLAEINRTVRDILNYTQPYVGPKARYSLGDLLLLNSKYPDHAPSETERERAGFIVFNKLGPLWYRGYFPEAAKEGGFPIATQEEVESMLDYFDAKSILVGHTIVPTVTSLYNDKVIAVQVYPKRNEQTG